ncbi:type I restriction enzyme S subunit [Actimicrobium sp. GrIS 1.19]|uniref:restriction endonuclease subunit S n=1 Tax=Actimicrobium sp. GrIS 1.19 TaxID=3071708 RepID=UPI002DF89392|nr:type I restriction enzyme S subunit [Actimicrobium sp. GrIS 1.19]
MITRNSVEGAFPVTKLGSVVNFLDSKRRPITESERIAGPYPYYGANGVQGNIDSYIFDEPLVLLAEDGGHFDDPRRGIAYRISGKTWVNNHAHVLQPKHGLDLAFLCRVLENYDVKPFVTGTTRGKLTKAGASEILIPMPPLEEQRRIAAILDQADALRAKRREALVQLDSLAQSIFYEMFGDPILNDRSWPFAEVSDFVAGFESGKSIVADDEEESTSPYRVLKISAVTSLEYKPEHSKAIPAQYLVPESHIVRKGDLLFSRANTTELIGATAFVNETPDNLLLPDKLWRFVWFDKPRAAPLYVRQLFQQMRFRYEIGMRASGSSGSMQNISQKKVLSIMVGNPPLELQKIFSARVEAIQAIKSNHRLALIKLEALFNSLQYRAFRGEL